MTKTKMENIIMNKLDRNLNKCIFFISPKKLSEKLYKRTFGKKLNLKNPIGFNEKLQWLKLNKQTDLIVKCADKYEMRQFVKNLGCEEILNEIYGVYDSVEEIDFERFPNRFAIKCTHGCGYNIICDDINKFDIDSAKKTLDSWMKKKFGIEKAETQYLKMKPKIICEKYIESDFKFGLIDYKIYCFNGEPLYTLVCFDRQGKVKKQFYDLNWNKCNLRRDFTEEEIESPSSYKKMLHYAKILSKEFEFVRVDFYEEKGKPILGELTFTPAACLSTEYTEEGEIKLGNLIKIDFSNK